VTGTLPVRRVVRSAGVGPNAHDATDAADRVIAPVLRQEPQPALRVTDARSLRAAVRHDDNAVRVAGERGGVVRDHLRARAPAAPDAARRRIERIDVRVEADD